MQKKHPTKDALAETSWVPVKYSNVANNNVAQIMVSRRSDQSALYLHVQLCTSTMYAY